MMFPHLRRFCTKSLTSQQRMWRKCALIPLTLTALAVGVCSAHAGGIAGTVRDASTSAPLLGIDMDIFDVNFHAVPGVNAVTLADGSYLLSPLPAGQYFLRVDPDVTQGYVDQYYPNVFLKSQALPITVPQFGTVIINFNLERGKTISGVITDASTTLPLANIDLDVFASDFSPIPSIPGTSGPDGTYVLGAFPPGVFYVKADPSPAQGYVDMYYNGKLDIILADPVQVTGTSNVPNVNFHLQLGGPISGMVTDLNTTLPLAGIDIDVYDALGNYISSFDASTDPTGAYIIGALPAGTYIVRADPMISQGHVGIFYDGVIDKDSSTAVTVNAGVATTGINMALPPGGTISGLVSSSVSGLGVPGVRIAVFDSVLSIMPSMGRSTTADGTFIVGCVPSGRYFVRSSGDSTRGLAFQFYPGVTLKSSATPLTVIAGSNTPNVNFVLHPGGWIKGKVLTSDTSQPLRNVDMDLYDVGGEFIGELDGHTDAFGVYTLGPVPAGAFLVKADPSKLYSYQLQYYDHKPTRATGDPIAITTGQIRSSIDFHVFTSALTGVEDETVPPTTDLRTFPNPFETDVRIHFNLPRRGSVSIGVYDVTGRRIRTLVPESSLPAGPHELSWDGRNESGNPVSSGIYFVRLAFEGKVLTRKIAQINF